MWNRLYGCIPRLDTFQMTLSCFRIINLCFCLFLKYKVSKKQGSGMAHIRDLAPKKGKQHPLVKFHGSIFCVQDYVVQHAPCDVGIIKVDSNDPVTRPGGGSMTRVLLLLGSKFNFGPYVISSWELCPLVSMKKINCRSIGFEMLLTNHRMSKCQR